MSIAQLSPNAPLFLGIEGGATHSVAILADARERLIDRVETGPANLKLLTDDQLTRFLAGLSRKVRPPAALCIGLAGLRGGADRLRVLAAASQVWPGVPCRACADLETAMAAASDSGASAPPVRVLVLSGTGSCCYGRTARGKTAKIGGWGHLLGDKGSGYEIGLRALKAVVYYYDRDGVWPQLGEAILQALRLNCPEDLIDWGHNAEKQAVAALAPEVFARWQRKDKIAADILAGAAHTLAADAAACAARLTVRRPRAVVHFVLAGSVLLKQPRFRRLVTKHLTRLRPRSRIESLKREGAWGAMRLAKDEWELAAAGSPTADAKQKAKAANRPRLSHGETRISIPEATALSPTERRNPRSNRLHKMSVPQAVSLMLSEEGRVPAILLAQKPNIVRVVELIVRAFRRGGRLFYVGAGTSGRIGMLDASECPPTFRTALEQVQGIMAGGTAALWQSIEGAEDDAMAGAEAIRFRGITRKDVVIGIAASGRTPFVWGALHEARRRSARTVLVCFNPHLKIEARATPDAVIAPDLGPEVLTGSTRLKAGTATKLLLNMFTTLSMVQIGKVISNLMVDLNPSNQKLKLRAIRIVQALTGADSAESARALEASGWVIKRALKRFIPRRHR